MSPKIQIVEKREFSRVPCGLKAKLECKDQTYSAVIKNLSMEGACVEIPGMVLFVGDPIFLTFSTFLEDGEPITIRCAGYVTWKDHTTTGVHFHEKKWWHGTSMEKDTSQ